MILLVHLLVVLVILALVWWVIQLIPAPPPLRTAITVVFALIAICYLLGVIGWVPAFRVRP